MTDEKKRDWIAILAAIGLAVSILTTVGGFIFYFGNLNSRLTSLEDKQKAQESTAVTQRDITQRDETSKLFQQELNLRLNRMDDKLDLVLENQSHRESGK